jgi:hypothetical protein
LDRTKLATDATPASPNGSILVYHKLIHTDPASHTRERVSLLHDDIVRVMEGLYRPVVLLNKMV